MIRRAVPTLLGLLALLVSCAQVPGPGTALLLSPASLPQDSGGVQSAHPRGTTGAPYGYWAYVPGGYDKVRVPYPLLVFLHGSGEQGDSAADPAALDAVLRNGPPKLIAAKTWDPVYPLVVVSPQCSGGWNAQTLQDFLTYLTGVYRIDRSRIYLTGLSMGGYGTYNYLTTLGDKGLAAAAVPVCGQGNLSQAARIQVPLWAFHGDADTTVLPGPDIAMVAAINAAGPRVRAKITVYPGVGHNSWSRTYDGSGRGTGTADSDPYDQDLWAWMFQYTR